MWLLCTELAYKERIDRIYGTIILFLSMDFNFDFKKKKNSMITYWGNIGAGKAAEFPPNVLLAGKFGRIGGGGGSRVPNAFGLEFIGACGALRIVFGLGGRLPLINQKIINSKFKLQIYPAYGCCKNELSNEFGGGPKLLFIWLGTTALDTPAANTDTGMTDPATFRAFIWKFSMIIKA